MYFPVHQTYNGRQKMDISAEFPVEDLISGKDIFW